jgi:hypothetical protein
LQVLSADENRLAAEQTLTNLRMSRRNMQIGMIKALGGGFDASPSALVVPTDPALARVSPAARPSAASSAQATLPQFGTTATANRSVLPAQARDAD